MLQLVNINPFNDGAHAGADCALAAGLGFDGVRVSEEFGWSNWETSLDTFGAAADDNGLFIMQTCQPKDHIMPSTDKDISAYAEKFAICASKPYVRIVGTGNEWNGFGINQGTAGGWDPVLAGEIALACLQACAKLPKAQTKGKFFITPEVCPGGNLVNPNNGLWPAYSEPLSWFKAMIRANPSILNMPHVGMGWHPYDDPRQPAGIWADWNTCIKALAAHGWLLENYNKTLPFVFGEYGTPIRRNGLTTPQSVGTEAQQKASFIDYQKTFAKFHQAGMAVKAAAWFRLDDIVMADTSDWSACCGLLDLNGDEREICDGVRTKNGVA